MKGVSNQQLCDALNFKYTTFMDWIKGVTYPRIGKIEAMANYFGVMKSDLIEEKTGSRPEKLGVLSSEYHLFRASLFAADCGVEAVGIPATTSWFSIRVNYFLREVAGVWHYLILGGQYGD